MRQRSLNYFVGSLFSRQAIFAYSAAGAFTTALQLLVISTEAFAQMPQRTEALPRVVELYIETLIPLWVPPITEYNVAVVLMNLFLTLMFLAVWTLSYGRSY